MKLFLDTMLWLHYQPPDDLDWTRLVAAGTPLTIVVPRITTRELDKHKNSHRSTKVKDRARRWLKQFTAAPLEPLKNGVGLELFLTAPKVDWPALGLDPASNDDALLAAILEYQRANPKEEVRFFTADASPRLMAAHLNILVFEFPEDLKLDEDPDPTAKELRELKAEAERSKRAKPRLSCGFLVETELTSDVTIQLSPPPPFPEAALKQELVKFHEAFPPRRRARYRTPQEQMIGGFFEPEDKEYDRYNAEVKAYPSRLTEYCKASYARLVLQHLATNALCQVRNDGASPADDVDLELHFPKCCQVMETLPEEPEAPREPEPPKSRMDIRAFHMPSLEPVFASRPEPEPFSISRNESGFLVKKHFARIKHGHAVGVDQFLLTFSALAHAKSFTVKGRITAANLPDPVQVVLNVKMENLPEK